MPPRRTTPKGYENARKLRKVLTPAERKLWAHLSNRKVKGVKFRKQHAIGNYVPDFCAIKEKLIIELDGSQHLDQQEYDAERTKYLQEQGYKVIRFWNNQVMNDLNGVILAIIYALEENHPYPSSPKSDNDNLGNDENPPAGFGGGAEGGGGKTA